MWSCICTIDPGAKDCCAYVEYLDYIESNSNELYILLLDVEIVLWTCINWNVGRIVQDTEKISVNSHHVGCDYWTISSLDGLVIRRTSTGWKFDLYKIVFGVIQ